MCCATDFDYRKRFFSIRSQINYIYSGIIAQTGVRDASV